MRLCIALVFVFRRYLSLHIDKRLKRSTKEQLTSDEIEVELNSVMSIFCYLQDKDLFERYLKGHFAKRLLFGLSASDDAERSMIARFRKECGYQYTMRLEGKF